jgi:probable addiction module antidote protein
MAKMDVTSLPEFDAADYLTTPERQAEFLSAALEDGDDAGIRNALGVIARARGMTSIAEATDMNRQGLYVALSENGNPAFSTVMKIVRAMGMKITITAPTP